jgi:hypothetical protein
MLPVLIEIELDAVDYQDAAGFGLSRIDATIASRSTQTSVDAIPAAVWNSLTTATYTNQSFGDRILISNNNNRSVQVTGAGSGHVAADVHAMQPNVMTADALATSAVTEIQNGLATSAALAAVATNVTALVTRIPATLFAGITSLAKWLGVLAGKTADATTRGEINLTPAGASYNETTDSLEAIRDVGGVGGGGAGGVTNITVEDRSITLE